MKSFIVEANDVKFYCEMGGRGPILVFMPDGRNDCGPFAKIMTMLSEEFTVLTLDPRGGSRSQDPNPQPVTAQMLADDLAGILDALEIKKASFWGCSSGGLALLSLGINRPDLVVNLMPHEAALCKFAPLPNTHLEFFMSIDTYKGTLNGLDMFNIWDYYNYDAYISMGKETIDRIQKNLIYWRKYYLGTVDNIEYEEEELKNLPPTDFTVGTFSPAWLVFANIHAAKLAGNRCVTWLNSAHHPEVTCVNVLSDYIRKTVNKYL